MYHRTRTMTAHGVKWKKETGKLKYTQDYITKSSSNGCSHDKEENDFSKQKQHYYITCAVRKTEMEV